MLHSLLSSRMQYSLWFILLGLLSVPFLPIRTVGIWQIFVWIKALNNPDAKNPVSPLQTMSDQKHINSAGWINDFSISVSEGTPSVIGLLLLAIWLLGILAMLVLVAKSGIRLYHIKQSALPLQNQEVKNLYSSCLEEMKLNRSVPIYSTAFLKSPVMTGLFVPRIYLPVHLISAYNAADMRYMLLHELQHYKYKDAFANYLMILAGIVYWFNPLVWYALREMRNDREVACDTFVLHMLDEKDYEAYGHTLIDFAEKISLNLYPFAAEIGGSMKQMKRRIQNIASYEPQSFSRKLKGCMVFGIIGIMLFCTAPTLSMYASEDERYQWTETEGTVSYVDFPLILKVITAASSCMTRIRLPGPSIIKTTPQCGLTRIQPIKFMLPC